MATDARVALDEPECVVYKRKLAEAEAALGRERERVIALVEARAALHADMPCGGVLSSIVKAIRAAAPAAAEGE